MVRNVGVTGVLAFGILLAACGGGAPATRPAVRAAEGTDRIELLRDGGSRELDGTPVALGGDLTAGIRITHISGVASARLLTLTLAGPRGPVAGANVLVESHMSRMDHAAFRSVAAPSGEGRYVAALPFAMPGEWRLQVDVGNAPGAGALELALNTSD